MNEFFEKHFRFIVLILLVLILGGGGLFQIIDKVFPDVSKVSKDFMREMMIDVIQEELKPMKESIDTMGGQLKILSDNVAEEWVRIMEKQYLKVQTNRDDLSWGDVEYALSKWNVLPREWLTPALTAKLEYLQIKYEDHIQNGGGS